MPTETVIRETSAVGFREQIVNLVSDRKTLSERFFTGFRKKLPELYGLYRGSVTGKHSSFKNDIHIPLILSVIQSDVARKTQTSFSAWPIVNFVGYGPDDAPIARKREALISAQMKDAGSFLKAYDFFLGADLYGTSVARWGWTHREQEMMISKQIPLPVAGVFQTVNSFQNVVTFDGPDWQVIDLLDFFPQPGCRTIPMMSWVCEREFLDLDDVRALARPDEDGLVVFDPDEVARMEREGIGVAKVTDDFKSWRSQGRTLEDEQSRWSEKYARPVELIHMWGRIPSELTTDGVVDRVITVANGSYLLRNRGIPFWSGFKPYESYSPMPDPHYFFAAGKAEVSAKLQIIANRFTNQQLDALDIFIDPAFFYNSNANINTRNLLMRPGKFIPVQGNPSDAVQPVVPSLQGVQMGGQMTQMVWQWMQQGTGIVEDTVMGGQGGRQTAREYLGRAEAVATRLMLESRLFEEGFLEPLANTFVDLNRQFMTSDREVFILGQGSTTDPVTGLPIPESSRQTITGWDLVPNYEARAIGSTTRLGRAARQQNLTFLLQAASANPISAAAVNWINFFRQIFREFEIENVNELLKSEPEMQRALEASGAQRPDQVPEASGSPQGINDMANFLGQGGANQA
jgi:hypothetical protein